MLFHVKPLCFHGIYPFFPRKRNNQSYRLEHYYGGRGRTSKNAFDFPLKTQLDTATYTSLNLLNKTFRSYKTIRLQTSGLRTTKSNFLKHKFWEQTHNSMLKHAKLEIQLLPPTRPIKIYSETLTWHNSFKSSHSDRILHTGQWGRTRDLSKTFDLLHLLCSNTFSKQENCLYQGLTFYPALKHKRYYTEQWFWNALRTTGLILKL